MSAVVLLRLVRISGRTMDIFIQVIVYKIIYALISSASADTILFPSALVALHRYLPLSFTFTLFIVKLLLTPLLTVVLCILSELYLFPSLSQVTVNELIFPLTKH